MSLVKRHIAQRFDQAANSYDQYAVIQYQIAKALFELCDPWYETVVDLGAGSGFMANLMQVNYPNIILLDISYQLLSLTNEFHQQKIQGDFEKLPIIDKATNAIVSNMALQWSDNVIKSLSECHRVLKDEGHLYLSMPIEGTFCELHQACEHVGANVKQFLGLGDITALLEQNGFEIVLSQQDYWQACFQNLRHLLKSIKATGVSYTPSTVNKTLRGKYFLRDIEYFYQALRTVQGLLPLTYQIGFIKAVKR